MKNNYSIAVISDIHSNFYALDAVISDLDGVIEKSVEVLMSELAPFAQKMIFCGHTHVQKSVWLPDGKFIVNPGSVGLPAYSEEIPYPHCMESMTPHAKYLIASQINNSWFVEHILLPYNYEIAAQRAEQNGRNDYAFAIRYGRAEVK
jgi:diadenosine tetraphosphatase ApaH/serine/threonine PP2A family protein phosphatase